MLSKSNFSDNFADGEDIYGFDQDKIHFGKQKSSPVKKFIKRKNVK